MSPQDLHPQGKAPNLDGCEKRGRVFGVAGNDSAPTLEVEKSVFHQVPQCIKGLVILPLLFAILARRNLGVHSLVACWFNNGIAVVALIGQQMPGIYALNQLARLRAICNGTGCNKNSDRHTMRIHGQMYLGVEPPLVRPMS